MAASAPRRYVLGEFVLEPDTLRLRRAGSSVHLTHKPFQVLLYLIEHRDRMVTRSELLERFWEGHDVYDETLTKCIGAIRQALDDQSEQPRFIVTHWAEGYRYIGPLEEAMEIQPSIFEVEKTRGVRIAVEAKDNGAHDEHAGLKKITSIESAKSLGFALPRRLSRATLFTIALVFISFATLAGFVYQHRRATNTTENQPSTAIRSLAVLPLKNLSGDQGQEYFSDGVTESLITSLSKIDGLKVISRGSVFRFKGKETDPRELGKQLGVAAVLEGSVRQNENSVRVTVRLVSAEDGHVLWAGETYERSLPDLFEVQDDIARQVASGLRFKLSGEDAQQLTKRYTGNVEAYQLYLKGRFFWNKRTLDGLTKALDYFQQAIRSDPNYALAYAGMADSYALFDLYSNGLQAEHVFSQAETAARKALELDDSLTEAHTSLAYVKYYYHWDWSAAEAEFKRAIDLNPNYATAHQWYAEYLFYMERFEESIAEINRAHQLDPFSLTINTELGSPYFYMRQYDEAIEKYRAALEMDQHFSLANYCLALCYAQKSMFDKAINMLGGGKDISPVVGYFFAASGRRREAQAMLDKIISISKEQHFSSYQIGMIYAGLGEKDRAFLWLEKAYEDRDERMVMLKVDPHLDNLRSDVRFTDLERRLRLIS